VKTIIYSIISLLFGVAILLLGHGLAGTLLTLRSAAEHFHEWQIGLMMSIYSAGYIIGVLLCPRIINQVGHIRAFTASAALCSSILLLHGLWVNPWFWMFARFIYGASIVSFYLIVESWLNARSDHSLRGKVFAIYMLVNLCSLAMGQQLLLLGDVESLTLFAVAAMLLSISLVPVALTRIPEPQKIDSQEPVLDLRNAFRTSPLGFTGCFIAGVVGGTFLTLGSLYANKIGLNSAETASFMSATIFGGALMQWPLGYLSDALDRRKVIVAVVSLASLFAAMSIFASSMPQTLMLLIMFLYGGFFLAIYPLSVAHANDVSPQADLVSLSGGLLMSYGVGAIIGPLIGGAGMQAAGPYFLPAFFSASWLALALYGYAQIRQHKVIEEIPTAFSPLVRTTQISVQQSLEEVDEEPPQATAAQ